MNRRVWLYLVLMSSAASLVPGQSSTPVVQARMLLATDAAHPGSSIKAVVEAQIASGYHINDHRPTLDYLIPTEVKLDSNKEISLEKVAYPKGEPKKFAFADQPLSVYERTLRVSALLRVAPGVAPGNYPLKGKLTYQACNDHACLPPASVPLGLTVKVVERGVALKRVNADVFNRVTIN
jgi:thiol:disulfide interchange protein DsbD